MKKYLIKWLGIILACGCVIVIILGIRLFLLENGQKTAQTEEAVVQKTEESSHFRIAFPEKYEGNIRIEENLIDKEIHIEFAGMTEFQFPAVRIEGNDSRVIRTEKSYEGNSGTFVLHMDEMYVCESSREKAGLSLQFEPVREKFERIIVIDPGHGGASDTGTIAYGYKEKELTLALARTIKEQLEAAQPESYVCLTRIGDTALSEQEREAFAEQLDADLYLSVHMNADSSSRATEGVSTYYNSMASAKGKKLAAALQRAMEQAVGSSSTVEAQTDTEIFTKDFSIPAVVIEAGYLTNKQEAMKLATAEYRKQLADGIVAGIRESEK